MSAESTSLGDVDKLVIQPWATTFLPDSVVKKCIASLSVILSFVTDIQGVIYPVSHRSLRIKFWALRTNCETQSKKVRIKKIICEAVQSMHRTRFAAACAIAIASTISASRKLLVSSRRSPAPVLTWRRVDYC